MSAGAKRLDRIAIHQVRVLAETGNLNMPK